MKFHNLSSQYRSLQKEINQAVTQVLQSGHFSEGNEISRFESQFANTHLSPYCIALNSGTSALHTILKSLDITSGHQVIVPTNTCFPTVEAIYMTGAQPLLVDCEPDYYNIDPGQIESVINENTKAIVAVHLYGQPAQMDKIRNIADKHNLLLIEDCSQAHLASFNGTMVGNFGIASAFSFYPTKNLGAFGEGGAVVTNDASLNNKIRAFKNHGSSTKNVHEFIGHNYRMDSIQAAILSVKLKHLQKWTERRRKNAQHYLELLADCHEIVLPATHPKSFHVYHQFVIRVQKRDQLQQFLQRQGIETAIHYPIPCHLQPALSHLGYRKGSFPIAEMLVNQILSLPVAEHLTHPDIGYICDRIKKFYHK